MKKEEVQKSYEQITIEEHLNRYLSAGEDKKSAMKLVAKDRGISKRDVYQYCLDNNL